MREVIFPPSYPTSPQSDPIRALDCHIFPKVRNQYHLLPTIAPSNAIRAINVRNPLSFYVNLKRLFQLNCQS